MPKHRSLDEAYTGCLADNCIQPIQFTEPQKARDIIENANIYQKGADDRAKLLAKNDKLWMLVYIDYYEANRLYSEAIAHLNKVKISNHQCLFAFICTRYSELDFDFFERIRTKRNGANYHGERLTHEDWMQVGL